MRITLKFIIVLVSVIILLCASVVPLSKFDKRSEASIKVIGFHSESGAIYYNDKDGNMVTGWQTIQGDKFYFAPDGQMVTGSQTIGDSNYVFGDNGKLLYKETDETIMNDKASTIASDTEYLLLVNCSTHRVGVYKGSKGNWENLYYWKCGDGAPGMETIKGEFKMGATADSVWKYHVPHFDSEGGRLWYATRINGHYLFHSVLYEIEPTPKTIQDGTIGEGVSHGCVRLELENAKWIYDNIPLNTKCVIYE